MQSISVVLSFVFRVHIVSSSISIPLWSCQISGAPRLTFLLCQSVSQLCKVQLCAPMEAMFSQLKILNRPPPYFFQSTLSVYV